MKKGMLDGQLENVALTETANQDCLVARFCVENGLSAAEVEIVQENAEGGTKWFVRRRREVTPIVTPEQLHAWYLEAVQKLKPESFNPNAVKSYRELTDEQRHIDQHIADRINAMCRRSS